MSESTVNDTAAAPGLRSLPPGHHGLALPVGSLNTGDPVALRLRVVQGHQPGPCLVLTGCIHGDEVVGPEIIRRVLASRTLGRLAGTLIAAPVVNLPAFAARSRYLPDRRDLNRLFPGSADGSLGARIARIVTTQVLAVADAVVDFHSGTANRPNLPQARVTAGDAAALELARAFAPPVVLLSPVRDGSLRAECRGRGIPVVVYESGEALRLDAASIRFGVHGVVALLRRLGMLPPQRRDAAPRATVVCPRAAWERSPAGGIFTPLVPLGKAVAAGDALGFVADPFSRKESPVLATRAGIVISRTNEGLADAGDALFNIAITHDPDGAEDRILASGDTLAPLPADLDDQPVAYDPFRDAL